MIWPLQHMTGTIYISFFLQCQRRSFTTMPATCTHTSWIETGLNTEHKICRERSPLEEPYLQPCIQQQTVSKPDVCQHTGCGENQFHPEETTHSNKLYDARSLCSAVGIVHLWNEPKKQAYTGLILRDSILTTHDGQYYSLFILACPGITAKFDWA